MVTDTVPKMLWSSSLSLDIEKQAKLNFNCTPIKNDVGDSSGLVVTTVLQYAYERRLRCDHV